ncbi:jg1098 [Pararge aegeria aegeria]|uniref:Jg1098 protein n=1 Tax=Pararge aegeria aegeria TaxID=348720 RepID=A0A8S4QTM5_9NEOP|nr:jg1098 [Pararge aegeria aegeria]
MLLSGRNKHTGGRCLPRRALSQKALLLLKCFIVWQWEKLLAVREGCSSGVGFCLNWYWVFMSRKLIARMIINYCLQRLKVFTG